MKLNMLFALGLCAALTTGAMAQDDKAVKEARKQETRRDVKKVGDKVENGVADGAHAVGTAGRAVPWNPTTGCDKLSAGCKFCYAEVMSKRLQAMGSAKYQDGFKVVMTHDSELNVPYTWKKPRTVFVNSMSDLFHKNVPLAFIQKVFNTMNECFQHTFQVLTKRGDLVEQYSNQLIWTPNIWMGVSVEDERVINRIDHLRNSGAQTKFLSIEPLLGPLPSLNLAGIDWVIVGGESGRNPRPMKEEWVQDIRIQCEEQSVNFFFKQWGGKNKKQAGRLLNGRTYDDMPTRLVI